MRSSVRARVCGAVVSCHERYERQIRKQARRRTLGILQRRNSEFHYLRMASITTPAAVSSAIHKITLIDDDAEDKRETCYKPRQRRTSCLVINLLLLPMIPVGRSGAERSFLTVTRSARCRAGFHQHAPVDHIRQRNGQLRVDAAHACGETRIFRQLAE